MTPTHPEIRPIGIVAGLLGVAAGAGEIALGTSAWFGSKSDPTTLGWVSVLLAIFMGAAGWASPRATTTARALAVAAGVLVPALLGLTTAGAAWAPAGLAGVVAGVLVLHRAAQLGSVRRTLRDHWPAIELGCLALVYLALGITARGVLGVVAVAGVLAIVAAVASRRRSRALATMLLLAGVIPFAALAWWSVVAPLTAALVLLVGLPLVMSRPGDVHRATPRERTGAGRRPRARPAPG